MLQERDERMKGQGDAGGCKGEWERCHGREKEMERVGDLTGERGGGKCFRSGRGR